MRWCLIPMMLLSCGVVSAQGVLERLRNRLQNAPLLEPVAPPPATRPELGSPRPLLGFQAEERTEGGVSSVHVDRVQPETAAAQAGLQPGDQIIQLGDQPISSIEDLTAFMAQRRVGEEVEIKVLREGQPVVAMATLQPDPRVLARPTLPGGDSLPGPAPDGLPGDAPADASSATGSPAARPLTQHGRLGVVVENVRPSEDAATSYVRISTVVPASAAAEAGLRPGDRIRQIDGVAVDGAIEVAQRMRATRPGQQVTIAVERDGAVSQVTATLTGMAPVLAPVPRRELRPADVPAQPIPGDPFPGDPTPADSTPADSTPADSTPVGPPAAAAPSALPEPQDSADAASARPAEADETATGETAELRQLLRELRGEVQRLQKRVEQLETPQSDPVP